jgi:hypothetical protein
MRVLFGVLLESCFVLATVFMAMFVVLLQCPCVTVSSYAVKDTNPKINPDAGFGTRERVKRPAFLPSTWNESLRRR